MTLPLRSLPAGLALVAGLATTPAPVQAAQSYDSCAGFIDALPATISTQGVWCLRKNLSTAITSGNAITIATNNVTIDCNDFKIGGLAAGDSSTARGIYANNRQNASVRHCAIRGFYFGINLDGGAGHLVEDNRLDNSLFSGIWVAFADNNRVQRNRVYDTGGVPGGADSYGILADADVIDNTVAGVFATATDTFPSGIYIFDSGSEARGNQVRGLAVAGTGQAIGILVGNSDITLADNRISAAAVTPGYGIYGGGANTFCTGNTVVNFATNYFSCEHTVDNLPAP